MPDHEKRKADARGRDRRPGGQTVAGSYFLAIEVENVRCFSQKQVLDLSDGQGRPARWTILLGENGTGKTTLLQLLVAFERFESTVKRGINRGISDHLAASRAFLRGLGTSPRPGRHSRRARHHFHGPRGLNPRHIEWEIAGGLDSSLSNGLPGCHTPTEPVRRLSRTSLSQPEPVDATESLFSEDARLINAEEWLLRLDYSASKSGDSLDFAKLLKKRLELAIKVLTRVLPDVDGIRFTSPTRREPRPRRAVQDPLRMGPAPAARLWISDHDRLDGRFHLPDGRPLSRQPRPLWPSPPSCSSTRSTSISTRSGSAS